jgi:hypothetical protein
VIIAPQGFVEDAIALDNQGQGIAAVVFVNQAAGPVNLSNITVDGAGRGNLNSIFSAVVGVLYQNTPGSLKDVTARNLQNIHQELLEGYGIYLEGGASTPKITVERCSIHDFDEVGIRADLQLNLIATQNNIYSPIPGSPSQFLGATGFYLADGLVTTAVSENIIQGGALGINEGSNLTGTISNNTLVDNQYGIETGDDEFSITGNKIIGSVGEALYTVSAVTPITGNTIVGAGVGIDFECVANPNVHNNTFIDTVTALYVIPDGLVTNNSYFGVGTIRTGGC